MQSNVSGFVTLLGIAICGVFTMARARCILTRTSTLSSLRVTLVGDGEVLLVRLVEI